MDLSYLVVMIPEADAYGAAGSGEDGCHGVEMDHHICNLLQNELLLHHILETSGDGAHCSGLTGAVKGEHTLTADQLDVCLHQDSSVDPTPTNIRHICTDTASAIKQDCWCPIIFP